MLERTGVLNQQWFISSLSSYCFTPVCALGSLPAIFSLALNSASLYIQLCSQSLFLRYCLVIKYIKSFP
jgi:hypothetical protein